jgi:hemoglobin-like flavoprotein
MTIRPKRLCELPDPPFTEEVITTVRDSLHTMSNAKELTRIFYRELFAMRPDARGLFPADMTNQEEVLLSGILAAINAMDDPARVERTLRMWGVVHRRDKQITDDLYVYVGHALVRAVQQLTPYTGTSVASAWVALYEWLAAVMIDGADRYDKTMSEATTKYAKEITVYSSLLGRHKD